MPNEVEAYIEAALWALKSGRPDVAERYLLAYQDEDGASVTISLTSDETIVEVR